MFKVGDMVVFKHTDDAYLKRCKGITNGSIAGWKHFFQRDKTPREVIDVLGDPEGCIIVLALNHNDDPSYVLTIMDFWKVPEWALKLYNPEPSKPYTTNTPGDFPRRRR